MRRRRPRGSSRGTFPQMLWVFVIFVVIVVVGVFSLSGMGSTSRNSSAVEFALNDFSGESIHLSDYRGKPVLVNLWASWCPPCRAEMPDLIKFYNAHQAEGLVFLAVNSEDDASAARKFVSEKQMTFPVLYDPGGTVSRIMGSNGLPDTYLIDPSGSLRFSWTGQISPVILDARVLPLLTQ